jgi:alpha-1,2-rhamnosyltransferase
VFVDCTETLMAGLNTGIQRVVRNVVMRLPAISEALGVRCVPVFAKGGRLWILDDPGALARSSRSGRISRARDRFVRLEAWFEQAVRRRLNGWPRVQRTALAAWGAPRQALKQAVRRLTRGKAARRRDVQPARPGPGDLILLVDAFWTSEIVPTLAAGTAQGADIVPVLYDLIPITHPHFFAPQMVEEFRAAFERLLGRAHAVLTDSSATLARLREYTRVHLPETAGLPGDFWYPGADLGTLPAGGAAPAVRADLRGLEGAEYFLMVGTLEPRKGQLAVLDAFESLWPAGEPARLVLAGRIGWRFAGILRRIEQSPFRGTRLTALHDATDAELDWLYRHASAVILASHEEGFGLPLVEAMHHGVPVIASDIPVFREVGGDYPVYFALEQPGALAAALATLRERLRAGWRPQPRAWPTWDEAAPELIRKALALQARIRERAAGR